MRYLEIVEEQQRRLADLLAEIRRTKSMLMNDMTGRCFRVNRGENMTCFRVEHAWQCLESEGCVHIDGVFWCIQGEDCMWLGKKDGVFNKADLVEMSQEEFSTYVLDNAVSMLSTGVSENIPIS